MSKITLFVVPLMLLASNLLAANFVELKDVSGKHIIKVEINKVADAKVQVTDEKGKTAEYPLNAFDRDSLIIILNVVAKMKDVQPPNPFNNSTIVAANFVELKDVSGKHTIKVEINKVADAKVQVTDEKGKTAEYPLNTFDRDSLIIILNVGAKMEDVQKPNDPLEKLTGTGHYGMINSVTYSPDGKRIACSDENSIKIWDANNIGKVPHRTLNDRSYGKLKKFSYSPDGKRIAVSLDRGGGNSGGMGGGYLDITSLQIWDANTGEVLRKLGSETLGNYSRDGKLLLSRNISPASVYIRIRDADTGEILKQVKATTRRANWLCSPDGQKIVTWGGYETIQGWRTNYTLKIWDTNTGNVLHTIKTTIVAPEKKEVYFATIAYSPDGKRIVGVGVGRGGEFEGDARGVLVIWDANTGKLLHTIKNPIVAPEKKEVHFDTIAYSPDGKRILTLGATRKAVGEIPVGEISAFGGSGKGDKPVPRPQNRYKQFIKILDANTGKVLHTLRIPIVGSLEATSIQSIAYSPDGKRIVGGGGMSDMGGMMGMGGMDGVLIIWDATTGEILDAIKSGIKK
jgi:WD40 repeat protein